MSEKSKQLLENLKSITAAPEKKILPYTNRFYIHGNINSLPKIYDKAKRHKDEQGEEFIWIDRLYGSLFYDHLIEKDGSRYKGKITKKRRLVKSHDIMEKEAKHFYSTCYQTADGRWFDNTGFPIDAPTGLEPEREKTPQEIEFEKEEKIRKEKRMLENLK